MAFATVFRRFRRFSVKMPISHTLKMVVGGLLIGVCDLLFVAIYPNQPLMPLGAKKEILAWPHPSHCLLVFAVLKGAAALFSLGVGGVSAMFVPLLLLGGSIGKGFGQSIVHVSSIDLYAAAGMGSFIAASYKTPLAGVIFVAETTGSLSFLIPSLIGAAVAYALSGETSVSADQRLHEVVKLHQPTGIKVREIMQADVFGVQARVTVRDFFDNVANVDPHRVIQFLMVALQLDWSHYRTSAIHVDQREGMLVGRVARDTIAEIREDADLSEAVRLLARQQRGRLVLVIGASGDVVGVITDFDIAQALSPRGGLNHDPAL